MILKDRKKNLEKQATSKKDLPKDKSVVDKEARLQEAREAYEAWLEYVDEREEEKRLEEEERKLREMWRPPWYPA